MEIGILEACIEVLLFKNMITIFVRGPYHSPVQVLNVEATVVSERFGVFGHEALSYQVHIHLVVRAFGQIPDI